MFSLDHEYTTVKVDARRDGPSILITPLDPAATEFFATVVLAMPASQNWHFQGTRYATPGKKDRVVGVRYACGGSSYRRSEDHVHWTDYQGAVKVYFDLSEVTDEDARYALRDFGFLSQVRLMEDSTTEQLILRAGVCKVCSGPLSGFMELEWKVCNDCSARCDHEYVEGVGQANGRIAYLTFCDKCGRGHPDWKPSENPAEDAIRTVTEGGLHMLVLQHPDGTSTVIQK